MAESGRTFFTMGAPNGLGRTAHDYPQEAYSFVMATVVAAVLVPLPTVKQILVLKSLPRATLISLVPDAVELLHTIRFMKQRRNCNDHHVSSLLMPVGTLAWLSGDESMSPFYN